MTARWARVAVGLACFLVVAAACGKEVPLDNDLAPPMEAPVGPPAASMVEADTAFTLELFKTVGQSEDGNVVLSPHGVDAVLSMILAGANGTAADELRAGLRHGASPADIAEFRKLQDTLRSRKREGIEIDLTASVWIDTSLKVRGEYRSAIEQGFGAVPHSVDFLGDEAAARKAINDDVSKATRGHIPKLLKSPLEDIVLVLVSAAYMDAKWADPFEASDTRAAPFTLLDGSVVQRPAMHRTARYKTASGPGWRAIGLPYAGDELSMTVVVPDDVRAFEKGLDPAVLRNVADGLQPQLVELSLPKFEYRTGLSLNDSLKSMGMKTMFGGGDFTAIGTVPGAELTVSFVVHEAWVQVDEAGTKAAAATAGGVGLTSAPMVQPFAVDRPFVFLIRDRVTGAVLFLGRVADPA